MNDQDVPEPVDLAVLDGIRAALDAFSVRRVFGDPQTVDGITVLPVARVAGTGGGGGGSGTDVDNKQGRGFGTGFGFGVRPVGVYEVRDGRLEWKPIIDKDRLARGGLLLAGVAIVCGTRIILRRSR